MAFGIAAGIAASSEAVALELEHDFRAGLLGLRVVCIRILDDQVAALRLDAANFVGLPHELVEIGVAQWISFSASGYLIVTGIARRDAFADLVPSFRAVAEAARLKQP